MKRDKKGSFAGKDDDKTFPSIRKYNFLGINYNYYITLDFNI